MHKNFEGKGYVSEAVNALTRYGFSVLGARRLEIRCDSKNVRSLSVMTRMGYVQEGLLRNDDVDGNDCLRDTIITARLNADGLPELDVKW